MRFVVGFFPRTVYSRFAKMKLDNSELATNLVLDKVKAVRYLFATIPT